MALQGGPGGELTGSSNRWTRAHYLHQPPSDKSTCRSLSIAICEMGRCPASPSSHTAPPGAGDEPQVPADTCPAQDPGKGPDLRGGGRSEKQKS